MNHYTFVDIEVGLTERFEVTISLEMMEAFKEMTGDISPIHLDTEYARERGYPGKVVYGMLGASLFSTLAGVYLPGEHCLLYGVECKFVTPIFIGDRLTISGTVVDKSEIGKEVKIKATVKNQLERTCIRGIIKAGLVE